MDRRTVLAAIPLAAAAVTVPTVARSEGATDLTTAAFAPGVRPPLFAHDDTFWFDTLRNFGAADYGGSCFGEVAVAASHIEPGNFDSWYAAWNDLADRISGEGDEQIARHHKISARDSYLRAFNYYFTSDFFLHGNPKDPRIARAYKRAVSCYQASAALFDPPIEAVEIPYEQTTLPGYLHRPDRSGKRRPTLIMHTGFDGSAEGMHLEGARAAVERGYNVLAFDGPGQYGPLHRQGLVFRPDWENVITPAVDFLIKQDGVDAGRIALMGVSMGGVLAPRAAAFEKRIAALIANDGIYDFAAPLLKQLLPPGASITDLTAANAPLIDDHLNAAMARSTEVRWAFTHGMWSTGAKSPREFLAKMLDYNLKNGVAERISCPTLVCDAEDDMFLKGQPQILYDHLKCKKTIIHFTRAEGAGAHCQLGVTRFSSARIFDWLDETFA